jgi:hypothetical protein
MTKYETPLSPTLKSCFKLQPIARQDFKEKLQERLLTVSKLSVTPTQPVSKRPWFVWPIFTKWALTGFVVVALMISFLSFQPVWSQVRERIRRFFIITTTEDSITTSTQFWSNLSQNELVPNLPSNPNINNSLTPQEQKLQPTLPPGFTTIAEYIIATYHPDRYSSIAEILASTPAKIIREESYYEIGKLYILEFPGGYLISYTELNVRTSTTTSTLIRTIR